MSDTHAATTYPTDHPVKLLVQGDPVEVTVLDVRPVWSHFFGRYTDTVICKCTDGGHLMDFPAADFPTLIVQDWPPAIRRQFASCRLRQATREAKDAIRRAQDHLRSQIRLLEDDLHQANLAAQSYPDLDDLDSLTDGDLIDALEDADDFPLSLDDMLDLFGVDDTDSLKGK